MSQNKVVTVVLQRLPVYLVYLKSLPENTPTHISATTLSVVLGMGEVQVRKDLASVCSGGRPKVGYNVMELIDNLETFLGYKNIRDVIIVGAGKLGSALLDYKGFSNYGFNIVAAFDSDPKLVGETDSGKQIFSLDKCENLCKRLKIKIGIIAVPSEFAQEICDLMINCGIQAIWNFAPTHLNVPDKILVKNENMAVSLVVLINQLTETLRRNT